MRRGMRVTCPNCLTDYDVPDDAIAGRPRTVRCARCGHQWRHGAAVEDVTSGDLAPDAAPLIDVPPLLPAAAPEKVFAARPAGFAALRAPLPPPRRTPWAAILAVVVLAVVVVGLAAHRPVMRVWPSSAGFYRALGLG